DLGAEDLADLHHLGAACAVRGDLEQRELARERLLRFEIADLEHVDELVQLLGDLVDRVERSVERQRDSGEAFVVGGSDGERVDVESAPREQPGDAGQDTGLVLDEDRDDVFAARAQAARRFQLVKRQDLFGSWLTHDAHPTMFRAGWPAGIIGYVFSSRVTRTSTSTGPSVASAPRMSSTSVRLSSKRMPVAPWASASLTKSGH